MITKRRAKFAAFGLVILAVMFVGQTIAEILMGLLWLSVGVVLICAVLFVGPWLATLFDKEPTKSPRRTSN